MKGSSFIITNKAACLPCCVQNIHSGYQKTEIQGQEAEEPPKTTHKHTLAPTGHRKTQALILLQANAVLSLVISKNYTVVFLK